MIPVPVLGAMIPSPHCRGGRPRSEVIVVKSYRQRVKEEQAVTENRSASTSDYLSAERTFLAWIRTGLALIGFDFVIAVHSHNSNPNVLMVEPTKNRCRDDAAEPL
jgi:hypothetical protein